MSPFLSLSILFPPPSYYYLVLYRCTPSSDSRHCTTHILDYLKKPSHKDAIKFEFHRIGGEYYILNIMV